MLEGWESRAFLFYFFCSGFKAISTACVCTGSLHAYSYSLSFCMRTSILCVLNVSQRAERGPAKEIREEKSTGGRGRQRGDFESVRRG